MAPRSARPSRRKPKETQVDERVDSLSPMADNDEEYQPSDRGGDRYHHKRRRHSTRPTPPTTSSDSRRSSTVTASTEDIFSSSSHSRRQSVATTTTQATTPSFYSTRHSSTPAPRPPSKENAQSTRQRDQSPKENRRPSQATERPLPQFISFANTSSLLIHLSERIIALLNQRNYTSPFLSCLAPDVQTTNNSGRDAVIEGFKRMVQLLPNYHNEIQHSTCVVDEDNGKATVVMSMKVSGFLYGTVRQSVASFVWTRGGDRWSCAAYDVIRGIEEFD